MAAQEVRQLLRSRLRGRRRPGGVGPAQAGAPAAPRQEDIQTHANDLRRSEEDVRRNVIERVRAHDLAMKVSDTEWQWDRNKLTIYFTAEKRVDFRALVRDLASTFRTRIELRQIGVRDEAARLAGVGRCGREYCCSTWLTELRPVNLALAKDQHLSLNPARSPAAAAACSAASSTSTSSTSPRGSGSPRKARPSGPRGPEKVIAVDIFRERVFLRQRGAWPPHHPAGRTRDEVEQLGDVLMTPEPELGSSSTRRCGTTSAAGALRQRPGASRRRPPNGPGRAEGDRRGRRPHSFLKRATFRCKLR